MRFTTAGRAAPELRAERNWAACLSSIREGRVSPRPTWATWPASAIGTRWSCSARAERAQSDRPADPVDYRLDDYVSDLDALREHLGLEQMLLLGYSHGGVVAQAYASAHPQRVSRLVLAVTLARFGPEQEAATKVGREKRSGADWYPDAMAASEEELGTATDEQVRDNAMRGMPFYFARFGPAEAAYVDTFRLDPINGDAQRAFGSELPDLDLRSRLANITAPTLVITGEDDFICGPVCAHEISAAIHGSREVIVPDAGHMLVFEQRLSFHDEVANFLG